MKDLSSIKKLFTIPKEGVNDANFAEAMKQAISLELATIPTYLSTYYSIQRTPDQAAIYQKILSSIPADLNQDASKIAEEMTLDVMVYSNKKQRAISLSVSQKKN